MIPETSEQVPSTRSFRRTVWCREDDDRVRPGGVPGGARHPDLLSRRRQREARPQQEPELLTRGPGGEHPTYLGGREAVRRRRHRLSDELHQPLQGGAFMFDSHA